MEAAVPPLTELESETARELETLRAPLGSRILSAVSSNILLVAVLAIVAVCIAHGISIGEFHLNFDESLHAMSGYFFFDFARELPLRHPMQYAQLYYCHYPALSGLIHWPPVFYICEAISFLIFGPSVQSARATVLAFSLVGIFFWYRMVLGFLGKWAAAFSSLAFALVPAMLLYEKAVMLEVPMLAVATAAIYYWVRYCREERARDLLLFAVFTAIAALVKYTTFFLIPFCLLTTLMLGKWRLMWRWRSLGAIALIAALIGYYYYLLFTLHWASMSSFTHAQHENLFSGFAYYWVVAREQLGWPLLILSVAGMVSSRFWDKSEGSKVMFSWILACYLTFSVLEIKQGRHVLCWVPPFVYFAAGFLLNTTWPKAMRIAGRAIAILLTASAILAGWTYQRPYVQGYQQLASQVAAVNDHGVILYDADIPGNFTFFLHRHDAQRRFVVLRKLLYQPRMPEEGGSIALLHTPGDIIGSLKRNGVRYIIVSELSPLELPIQQTLRDLLKQPDFRLIARIPIQSNKPDLRDSVALYEYEKYQAPQMQQLDIPMRTLPNDIVVPQSQLNAW
jgi:hypothetical protein